ncbi:MAG TPA: c(7)-type cytochrome triheme domain-containing protein, partial [Gemmatimonadaceae bacterium]|nr:c(7)-type cytochrome triheme domain-containing protein [Gemmatimonadaceae bacterium]
MASAGCGRRALAVFFDIPEPAQPAGTRPVSPDSSLLRTMPGVPQLPPPAFESTLDPDSAVAMLPRDNAGNIDWQAALRQGVIRPRPTLPGRPIPDTVAFRFNFDFFFPGPDTTFDASFPHSTHTQWVNCNQCHSRIFKYRDAPIKMADIFQGKYCAECHGKVAYPVVTGCERCHTRLKLPPNRAKPELLGTITLARHASADGNASGVDMTTFPRARFPHWVHRSRYQCKSCHMELFEPKAGANQITMKMISSGLKCGACHDGKTAFA